MNIIEIIDANEEKTFHPSLDIKDNMLVLGFRIKKEKDKESDLFFINTTDGYITTEKTEFTDKEQTFSIEKKKRVLSKLSQKWGEDNLNKLIEALQNPLD